MPEVEEFGRRYNVSRETIQKLRIYSDLAKKWSKSLNIVAKSTLDHFWSRHIVDSAAVFQSAGLAAGKWLDIGSGGGLPGLVVAILANELTPKVSVTCVEADLRKCEFMRTVARETGTKVGIISRRVEDLPLQRADVITARAFAPLDKLLPIIKPHLGPGGVAILHKGENWRSELDLALESWEFTFEKEDNTENPGSVLLKIGDILSD